MATVTTDPAVEAAERAKPTEELGVSGLVQFHGHIEEAYLAELRWPAAWTKFNEMRRRDPTIASLLNAITLLARTASWSVEPAGTSGPDKLAAEFLEQCVDDMSYTVEDAVEDLLTALPFGWAWSELVYKRRNGMGADPQSKHDDGRVGWRKWAPRRQSSFYKWEFDSTGGVQGLWQSVFQDVMKTKPTVYIPISKSLHFIAQRDQGNPEGIALLEPIYEAWHFVKNLQIILGIGWERSFVGLPWFEYAENYKPNADDMAIVAKTGKGLRVDEKAYVALPAQIKGRLESTTNQGAPALLDTIKHYRITMLQVVLADFLALGTTASGGSYSLGQDKSALFLMAVDGWLDRLAHPDKLGVFNRYAVPRLFSYNAFDGITDFPRIKHSTVQKPSMDALAKYLQSITSFITPDEELEKELRKYGDLPPPSGKRLAPRQPQNQPGQQAPDAGTQTSGDQGTSGQGPETGDQVGNGGDGTQMADPHPPARGQRYFVMQWNRLADEFRRAMAGGNGHGNGDGNRNTAPTMDRDSSMRQ